jgi:hypothetical protein
MALNEVIDLIFKGTIKKNIKGASQNSNSRDNVWWANIKLNSMKLLETTGKVKEFNGCFNSIRKSMNSLINIIITNYHRKYWLLKKALLLISIWYLLKWKLNYYISFNFGHYSFCYSSKSDLFGKSPSDLLKKISLPYRLFNFKSASMLGHMVLAKI